MNFSITQTLTEPPVSLQSLKKFLKVDFEDHDDILSLCLNSTFSTAGKFLNKTLCNKEIQININSETEISNFKPVSSILNKETKLISPSGTISDKIIYFDIPQAGSFEVILKQTISDLIPHQLIQAMLLHAAYLYENEEYSSLYIPAKILSVYSTFKKIKI